MCYFPFCSLYKTVTHLVSIECPLSLPVKCTSVRSLATISQPPNTTCKSTDGGQNPYPEVDD
jgi:hypothetical protein